MDFNIKFRLLSRQVLVESTMRRVGSTRVDLKTLSERDQRKKGETGILPDRKCVDGLIRKVFP